MAIFLGARNSSRKVRRKLKTQSADKPDMIEANTTYLWQALNCVDTKGPCASAPASSTNNIHADIGVSSPVSAFFIPGNTSLPQV